MHWCPDSNFYITSRQLVDIVVIRLKNPHKHMLPAQAQTRTPCFCSCLSLQLLPVRDGNFQLGNTANVIIQWQEYRQSIQTHFLCLPHSLFASFCCHYSYSHNALDGLDHENVFLINAIMLLPYCFFSRFLVHPFKM